MPKISEFPNTATLADTDELVVASGGANKNIQYGQLHTQLGVAFTDTSGALSVESAVADGGVAFSFDTSNAIPNGKLFSLNTNGTERIAIYGDGYLQIDGDGYSELTLLNDDDPDEKNFVDLYTDSSTAQVEIRMGGVSGNVMATLSPAAAGTPYKFDTPEERAPVSGGVGNLFEVLNDGTSKFAVRNEGSIIVTSNPPASAAAAGLAGTITWDSDYVYVCVATGTWKRAALSTWP